MATEPIFDVRATTPDEWRVACDTMRAALLSGPVSDDDWAKARARWEDHLSFTAWADDRCVGHAGAFRFDTVVPGGARVSTAGVTRVGVLPTATRHGLLSRMMRDLLVAARAEGRVLASLRASEAVIYRRFGFGVAADSLSIRLDTRRARPIVGAAPGSVRVLQRSEILDVVPAIYDRIVTRPGAIARPSHLWQRYLDDALVGDKAGHVVVHTSVDGVDDGFAHYTVAWHEEPFNDAYGVGEVHDMFGSTAAVELALWAFLVGIDLIRHFDVEERPLDDPMRLAVRDRRACETKQRFDEQWLRLLDVESCLAVRTYRPGPAVTIAVRDPWFDDNDDVFEVGSQGIVRRGRTAAADLTVEIDVLSAAYLGAVSWSELAAVGLVAGDATAVARADDLFASRPLAWCGSFF
jgi:predicted acetyltransferase